MRRMIVWLGLAWLLTACAAQPLSAPELTGPALTGAPEEFSAPVATAMAQAVLVESDLPTVTATLPPPTDTPGPVVYTVVAGDSLWKIAQQYGVPIAALQLQNGLGEATVVRVGQVLTIPPAEAWEGAPIYWIVHVVAPGETLSGIAALYGLEMARLLEVNSLHSADALPAGHPLVLPLQAPAEVTHARPPTATPPRPTPTPTRITLPTPTATADGSAPLPTVAPTAPPAAAPPADVADWPRAVFDAMNQVRAAHGLPPYLYNETLAVAAQRHAEDCSQRQACSHTGSDGSTIQIRIERVGYVGTGAECWAAQKTPQGAVDVWMDETPPNDPHRRMMLHTWFTEVGIGLAPSPWAGYYYIIADFGRPK